MDPTPPSSLIWKYAIFIAEMTCTDGPCQNGGKCSDATKSCSDDTDPDPECGFVCECPVPFAGHLCNVYRRCFADVRLCFQTDYEKPDYNYATEHCLRQGNLTKPIILNRHEADNLQTYVKNDTVKQLMTNSIWLAGETKQLAEYSTVYWQWLDGLHTSTYR